MNTQKRKSEALWLAIAHVRPQVAGELLDGAAGAHVAVFGHIVSRDDFVLAANRLLAALKFNVIEIDEIERISLGEFRHRVPDEMYDVAKSLNEITPVGYGTFFTYDGETVPNLPRKVT